MREKNDNALGSECQNIKSIFSHRPLPRISLSRLNSFFKGCCAGGVKNGDVL